MRRLLGRIRRALIGVARRLRLLGPFERLHRIEADTARFSASLSEMRSLLVSLGAGSEASNAGGSGLMSRTEIRLHQGDGLRRMLVSLETKVDGLLRRDDGLREAATSLQVKVDQLHGKIDGLLGRIDDLQGIAVSLHQKTDHLLGQTDGLCDNTISLHLKADQLHVKADGLHAKTDAVTVSVKGLDVAVPNEINRLDGYLVFHATALHEALHEVRSDASAAAGMLRDAVSAGTREVFDNLTAEIDRLDGNLVHHVALLRRRTERETQD